MIDIVKAEKAFKEYLNEYDLESEKEQADPAGEKQGQRAGAERKEK